MKNDSVAKTLLVAGVLCICCSIMVSTAVVSLRPIQEQNKALDFKKNLLISAGLIKNNAAKEEIEKNYQKVEVKIIDLDTGEYVEKINPKSFDQLDAVKDPQLSEKIPPSEDLARIRRREKYSKVYLIKSESAEEIAQYILPIRGKGLWSTMYGFICLRPDGKTVSGFGFYQQGETPGLGGEVDNPNWKAQWNGKQVYDQQGNVAFELVKGGVNPDSTEAIHQVDSLSGATLTAVGVENLIHFWMGENGFRPFLEKVSQQDYL